MRILPIIAICLLAGVQSVSQVSEGSVVYERKINMHKRLPPQAEQMKAMIPEFQISKAELQFTANTSLFKNLPDETNQMPEAGPGGGNRFMFRMGGGANDEFFRDYEKEVVVESRELGPRKYLIDDTLRPLKWKLEEDTITIHGYLCYKATTTTSFFGMAGAMRPGSSDTSRVNEGMRRMNIPEEQQVVAWFTQDIATSAGPESYYGLPGLILKLVVDDGTIAYTALSVSPKSGLQVKAPTSGKKITREEYRKMMQQQIQNMGGRPGGRPGGGIMIVQ